MGGRAEDPHLVQKFWIDGGMATFNAVKIVPMITFKDVVSTCQGPSLE